MVYRRLLECVFMFDVVQKRVPLKARKHVHAQIQMASIYVRRNRFCITIYSPCIQDSAPVPMIQLHNCLQVGNKKVKMCSFLCPHVCAVCNSIKRDMWVTIRPSIVGRTIALWAGGPRYGGSVCRRNNAFSLIRPSLLAQGSSQSSHQVGPTLCISGDITQFPLSGAWCVTKHKKTSSSPLTGNTSACDQVTTKNIQQEHQDNENLPTVWPIGVIHENEHLPIWMSPWSLQRSPTRCLL